MCRRGYERARRARARIPGVAEGRRYPRRGRMQVVRWSSRRARLLAPASVDCFAWSAAVTTTLLLRFDIPRYGVWWSGLALAIPLACILQLAAGLVAGLYQGRWRIGSFEEVAAL